MFGFIFQDLWNVFPHLQHASETPFRWGGGRSLEKDIAMLGLTLAVFVSATSLVVCIAWRTSRTRPSPPEIQSNVKEPAKIPQIDGRLGIGLLVRSVRTFSEGRNLRRLETDFRKYGPTMSFWILGHMNIATCDPRNIKAILTQPALFELGSRRRKAMSPLLGKGIFALDGHEWKASRALLRPSFAKTQIQTFQTLEKHFQILLQAIVDTGPVVDLQTLFHLYTMDTATEMLTGKSIQSLHEQGQETKDFLRDWDTATARQQFLLLAGPVGHWFPDSKAAKAVQRVQNYYDSLVTLALEQSAPRKEQDNYIFLQALAKQTRDRKVLRDQTIAALTGGRDTTASLLSNVCYMLARNDSVWVSLRAEALKNEKMSAEDAVKECTFARWCILECMLPPYPLVHGAH